ncbi:MAG: SMC-Scp complex subunit ScpB [Candidatus Parcubacteria bacterium]|nr:SMC-Scp complex subunit ScpB [Candidatus Parcubacteria bacterium]
MTLISILESLLFTSGEPLSFETLLKISGVSKQELLQALTELSRVYNNEQSGLALVEHNGSYQLVTKVSNQAYVQKLVSGVFEEKLTPIALECLTIIAYRGPIGRSQIDLIRGVNSSYIIRQLVLRCLIERKLDPNRGNAFLYSISAKYLKHFGLTKIEDLPKYEDYHNKELQLLIADLPDSQLEELEEF